MGVEPFVVVVPEGLEEGVAGRSEEQGVMRWWDGEREVDGCGGATRAVHEEGLESGQGREMHRHVCAGHPVVPDSLKDRTSSCPLFFPVTTHVRPIHTPICRRGYAPVRPGDGPVCPSPLARTSDRPLEHSHHHDQAGPCQQVCQFLFPLVRDFLPATRNALKQLQDRCISFLVVVGQNGDDAPPPEQQRLIAGVQRSFLHTPSQSVGSNDMLPAPFVA